MRLGGVWGGVRESEALPNELTGLLELSIDDLPILNKRLFVRRVKAESLEDEAVLLSGGDPFDDSARSGARYPPRRPQKLRRRPFATAASYDGCLP